MKSQPNMQNIPQNGTRSLREMAKVSLFASRYGTSVDAIRKSWLSENPLDQLLEQRYSKIEFSVYSSPRSELRRRGLRRYHCRLVRTGNKFHVKNSFAAGWLTGSAADFYSREVKCCVCDRVCCFINGTQKVSRLRVCRICTSHRVKPPELILLMNAGRKIVHV